ncbi:conserved hypothetical protein [Theileria equi strain WA]|uniref:V-SNARE coiled-coil homology domain-containing protein n=1 Tax=Theileria equi strain WA TaxID=1537102 RepID=L1LDB3_THEEQ|nr:conserved hypothetical protein [Theileria equi strain WA]EKX73326.1 conserved hypothetical protein [Theileria equi strain WA]|eukprot:XP_004832778.1 conserved hypothetical protein [Theileria equi strain WA]
MMSPKVDHSKHYQDWLVIDELAFTSPKIHKSRGPGLDSTADFGCDTNENASIMQRFREINKETADDLEKIRAKLQQIENNLQECNAERYLQADPNFDHLDRLLGEAVKEVVEMQKGANTAVLELTRSVERIDSLVNKTEDLREKSENFRRVAQNVDSGLSFKVKLLIAAIALIAIKILFSLWQ